MKTTINIWLVTGILLACFLLIGHAVENAYEWGYRAGQHDCGCVESEKQP